MASEEEKGLTLIELVIVLAITGIIVALAIPQYRGYIARAQVSEAVGLLMGVKPRVRERALHGTYTTTIADLGVNTSGQYTDRIEITDEGGKCFTATIKTEGASRLIAGRTVSLCTLDDGALWQCSASGPRAIQADFLPLGCRG